MAIVITFILYRPIANVIIKNTQIDENLQKAISQNVTNIVENEDESQKDENSIQIIEQAKNGMLDEASKELAINIIYAATMILLYIVLRILLIFISFIANGIASLPILKQFNKAGGIIYGILRGVLITYVCLMLIGVFANIYPRNPVYSELEKSYLGKMMYENNILNIFFS